MITAIDHIVLSAKDLERTVWFYCEVLGMQLQEFVPADGGETRLALSFGTNKINLHDVNQPYQPHARTPVAGSLDICLLSDNPVDAWCKRVAVFGIEVELGPTARTGSTGPLRSIYIRDPDGNLVEISNVLDAEG